MSGDPTICVIVPSLALATRAPRLRRALASIRAQRRVRTVAVVVVNGDRFEHALVRELQAAPDVRLLLREPADLPQALVAGRSCVDTEWFAELDDDDELMPDALCSRLAEARAHSGCAAVISNGIVVESGQRTPHTSSWDEVRANPLAALAHFGWLRPGAGLFRSDAVNVPMMAGMPRYLEWTWLAARLALAHPLRFLDGPSFVYDADTPDSLWKSTACRLGLPDALAALLALELPPDVRRAVERRRTVACSVAALTCLQEGAIAQAWRWHLRALRQPGGWRYLLGTRRFLRAPLRSRARA